MDAVELEKNGNIRVDKISCEDILAILSPRFVFAEKVEKHLWQMAGGQHD